MWLSVTVSLLLPSKTSTGTFRTWDILFNVSMSGAVVLVSHFDIVLFVTCNKSANSCWVSFLPFLTLLMFYQMNLLSLSTPLTISICKKRNQYKVNYTDCGQDQFNGTDGGNRTHE